MSAIPLTRRDQFEVWHRYRATKSPELRDQLIVRYAPLVKYVAGRLAMGLPPMVEVDDLVSYGLFGLIDAIEKFDPEREVKFETYAIARIRGAMLDGLRAFDWIPYSARQKARDIERAFASLEAKLGRTATDSEIAEELGVSTIQLHKMLNDVRALTLSSLDENWGGEDEGGNGLRPIDVIEDPDAVDPVGRLEFEEHKEILADAIQELPEKERTVVTLYYYEGLTAKEISHILKVSQSRISQLHSKAVLRLRGKLRSYFNG